jgi:L-ascorbate metabolism protein UlaG (beta-lactamase superfamily)
MTAADAVALCELVQPHTALPVHYEGWSHFVEGREAIEATLDAAPEPVRAAFCFTPMGEPLDLEV